MNDSGPARAIRWLFDPRHGATNQFLPRWLFLRAIGLIYFSAFFSLLFQIRGLIGPDGILPASEYLEAVAKSAAAGRFWYAPTVFWFSTQLAHADGGLLDRARGVGAGGFQYFSARVVVCLLRRLSFVCRGGGRIFGLPVGWHAARSRIHRAVSCADGISARALARRSRRFAPVFSCCCGNGSESTSSRESRKSPAAIRSGGNFTAMDEYYQNGPLPTWIGWYMQHLPHWFHAATAFLTLALELVLVFMLFLPRRWRIVCFFIVTPWQIGVILTANYTFLNYLVLALGIFLLDDRFMQRFIPARWKRRVDDRRRP